MKKSIKSTLPFWRGMQLRTQQLSVSLGTSLVMFIPTIASADVGDAAKSAGSDVVTKLYIALFIVGGISAVVAGIKMAFGSQEMHDKGTKQLIKVLFGITAACLVGLIITWVYSMATKAGGGAFITWPV
ncbi:hypothetical protein LNP18_06055 [Leuconostoc citreum]|uniref:hypothetical protein n=1 Tax=Leuconostoc citreum TaxID=33964 RepID=UPI00200A98D8|nr:hypothetical protein [Leuconostoc citreum]MCK8605665.1 hypothetical protein [Leuconostoc citreum]